MRRNTWHQIVVHLFSIHSLAAKMIMIKAAHEHWRLRIWLAAAQPAAVEITKPLFRPIPIDIRHPESKSTYPVAQSYNTALPKTQGKS